jgi:hypothetical protein
MPKTAVAATADTAFTPTLNSGIAFTAISAESVDGTLSTLQTDHAVLYLNCTASFLCTSTLIV